MFTLNQNKNMKLSQRSQQKRSALPVLILTAIILIAAAVGMYVFFTRPKPVENRVNYNPPTNNERQDAIDQKEKNQQREEIEKSDVVPSTANVVITDANQYDNSIEVRGYVDNVYEDGGSCTATFTLGSAKVSKTLPIIKDAKTLQCGALDFERAQFSPGTWTMTLIYKSSTVQGSATKDVDIK